jgi:hypothetical protein
VATSTVVTFTLHFSTDGGLTWAATPTPPAARVTTIRAALNEPLPPGGTGTVTFAVTVD